MAIQNTNNLPEDSFVKSSIIRTAMLFNMRPIFDSETDTLTICGMKNKTDTKQEFPMRDVVTVSINGSKMPQMIAANSMSLLKQVYNSYAQRYEHSEFGYDGIPVYGNLQTGHNFEESYPENMDPELYVADMLTVMQQRGGLDATLAGGYKAFMERNFSTVISQIENSNWPDKQIIAKDLQTYWANLSSKLKAQSKGQPEQPARGDE